MNETPLEWVDSARRKFVKPVSFIVAKQFSGMFERALVDMKNYIENR